jgi:D-alanine-D-alanine ligase
MPEPRVLILHNDPILPLDHPDAESEHEVLYSVSVVTESLQHEGVPVARLGITADPLTLLDGLKATCPDVVFNLYEGTPDHGGSEAAVAGLLEWLRVPFTGCPSQSLALARNKPLSKLVLTAGGVRTPEHFVVEEGARCPRNPLGWPVIVKPGREDASVGIDQGAVVTSDRQLRDRVDYLFAHYGGPALVERFVTGREIHASVVELDRTGEPTVLPLAEIRFDPDEKLWPIYTYDAKWKEQSREYLLRPVDVPVTLPPDVTDRLVRATKQTYKVLGCRDHARVDVRVAPDGEVYVLELNPNPSITSVMLSTGLELIGHTYDGFMAAMARHAAARGGRAGPPDQAAGAAGIPGARPDSAA